MEQKKARRLELYIKKCLLFKNTEENIEELEFNLFKARYYARSSYLSKKSTNPEDWEEALHFQKLNSETLIRYITHPFFLSLNQANMLPTPASNGKSIKSFI